MKLNFKHIYEGWKNHLFPPKDLKELIEKVSKERYEQDCKGCCLNSKNRRNYRTLRVDEHCTLCGCPLQQLTKCLSCSCEVNLWKAALTSKQEQKLKENGE